MFVLTSSDHCNTYNMKKVLIVCLSISLISAMAIEYFANQNIASKSTISGSDNYDYVLKDDNYLSILKNVHENIDENVGKTVKITGYIFRMPDFDENTFVVGKNIVWNSEDSIAGFMCVSKNSKDFKDNEWVEITGIISKGKYVSDMPIIQVGSIKKVEAPKNTFLDS